MNLKLETEFSRAPILKEVDALKKQIDDMRPLSPDVEGRVMQKLRLDWNYNSNAIEGNKLSYGETVAFLMEGITAKGKPLKDHLDIRGHNEAINFLTELVKDTRGISETDIRALHKMILVEPYKVDAQTADGQPTTKFIKLGEYKSSANHVKTATGEIHYYATPEEVPVKIRELIEWYKEANNQNIDPLVIAALFHHKFVAIHPFDDGNGRLSRILMNLILMQKGFPPAIVKMDDRTNYYSLLNRADRGDSWPFIEYIGELVRHSLQLYLKAANGGDINEEEDIEKELALLAMRFDNSIVVNQKKDVAAVNHIILNFVFPLAEKLVKNSKIFEKFFFTRNDFLIFEIPHFLIEPDTVQIDVDDKLQKNYLDKIGTYHSIPDQISIFILLEGYKDIQNRFTLGVSTKIVFEDYRYRVLVDNELILSKLYHEPLQSTDESKVVRRVIEYYKNQLDLKLQSPESN